MNKFHFQLHNHLVIKPEYLNHPFVSGNKLRKLKYNIIEAKQLRKQTLLTFGGAYSNHIAAVAFAGREHQLKTIGVIRGDELKNSANLNATLLFARACGMEFKFVSRLNYRQKTEPWCIAQLQDEFGDFYLLPEGGTNDLAIKGCEEILTETDREFDFICCPVGTGGTISGLINSSFSHQKISWFSCIKR